jgi:adenosylcobinamide-phosphate synthase
LRILSRDGRKHSSPNAGLAEAAMAGALSVQLGGLSYYGGEPFERPTIGDPLARLSVAHIRAANSLMFVTAGLFLGVGLCARALVLHLWSLARAAA